MSGDIATVLLGMGHVLDRDFETVGNPDGTVSLRWFAQTAQPTEAEIDAAALGVYKSNRIAAIRAEARQRIEAAYPDWRQRSAALGLYPAEYVSTMQAAIASVIAASNTGEDAVDAAADVAAVEAVAVTWPVI